MTLLSNRIKISLSITIVISPPINSLVGEGQTFARMTSTLLDGKVGEID
jgi:hypothetical protein